MTHSARGEEEQRAFERWRRRGVALIECDLLTLPKENLIPPLFDVVYHLAAQARPELSSADFRVNSDGTRNLLQWLAPVLEGKRLIFSSTLACVDAPRSGVNITENTACRPRTAYGRTKLEAECVIREWHQRLKFDYTILRLCTTVGAGCRPTGMFGVLPPMLIRHAMATRLNWPGRVSLIGVEDVVRILMSLPDFPKTRNELFVMSNGENPSFDLVLAEMASILGCSRDPLRLPPWLWRMAGAFCWQMSEIGVLPHAAHTFFWRLSHMIYDGVCADGSKLDAVLHPSYRPYKECLAAIYNKNQTSDARAATATALTSHPGESSSEAAP